MDEPILVNGRAYDFAQIVLMIGGVPIASISEVEYEEEQKKENNYGAGNRPVSRGQASIKSKAAITVSMNDTEALRTAARVAQAANGDQPTGSLLYLPAFDVVISYLNNQQVVTHVLKNGEFMKDLTSAKLDDTDIKAKFELIISHILYT